MTVDIFTIPEQAIVAFETMTGLSVTIHDLAGSLWPFIRPERFQHQHPLCAVMKASVYNRFCHEFDSHRIHREISNYPTGRIHLCHAGLVECVVPITHENNIVGVLFAGPRTPSPQLTQVTHDRNTSPTQRLWPYNAPHPKPIADAEAQTLLECTRQLAARLELWLIQAAHFQTTAQNLDNPNYQLIDKSLTTRRQLIFSYIQRHHTQPITLADIARILKLSESHAGHTITQLCGSPFSELLKEARLRTAAALLRHSTLSVLEVANQSGYTDISHFHRHFRQRMLTTPLQYRKNSFELKPDLTSSP